MFSAGLTSFSELCNSGEYYGRMRSHDRSNALQSSFILVLKMYCSSSARMRGQTSACKCKGTLFIRQYRFRRGWKVQFRGAHTYSLHDGFPTIRDAVHTLRRHENTYETLFLQKKRRGNSGESGSSIPSNHSGV